MIFDESMLHCGVSPDLMGLQVLERLGDRMLGIKVAGALGPKHDTQRIGGGRAEFQRIVIGRLYNGVA